MPSAWPDATVWPSNMTRPPKRPGSATRTKGERHMRSGSKTPGASPPSCPLSRNTACPEPVTGILCAPLPKTGWCWTVCSTSRTRSKKGNIVVHKKFTARYKTVHQFPFQYGILYLQRPNTNSNLLPLSLCNTAVLPGRATALPGRQTKPFRRMTFLVAGVFLCLFWLILGAR